MGGFLRVPYNDVAAIERIGESNASVVAILMEVLQGEGGIHVADPRTCGSCARSATASNGCS
jgi:acetylornithine aminotransferase